MEMENEFGKEVEKEMMEKEISEEETKIDLNDMIFLIEIYQD